jgi:hypothetical protein
LSPTHGMMELWNNGMLFLKSNVNTKLGIRNNTEEREKRTIEARKNMKSKKSTSKAADKDGK